MDKNNRLKKLENAAGGEGIEVIYVDWNEGEENTFVNFVSPASMKGVKMTVAEFREQFPDAYATRIVVNYEDIETKASLFNDKEGEP